MNFLKPRPNYMIPKGDTFQLQGHTQSQREGMKKYISCKWNPRESRVAIFISDKIDLKSKTVTGN